jgi:hypothetical protein
LETTPWIWSSVASLRKMRIMQGLDQMFPPDVNALSF